jgi:thiol-disulfide isomerase/thioredoxin
MDKHGRRRIVLLALLGALGTAHAVDAGQGVPDVELPASTVAARLSDLKGQWVYLDFWASWCGPCRLSFAFMNELQQKYAAHGLKIVRHLLVPGRKSRRSPDQLTSLSRR